MRINEINSETKNISLIARVEKVILSTGNNGANYLVVNLADSTGRIEARLWNCEEEDVKKIITDAYVKVDAVANVYRQQLQLKINSYLVIDPVDFGKYQISEDLFLISAPLDVNKQYKALLEVLGKIKNPVYKKITIAILNDYENEFKTFPAATSIHHNVVGGLFWHSVSLLKAAISLKDVYKYAQIDWELVICGAILHDIGKVVEMKGKTASEYTDAGRLIGHISIGNTFVAQKAKELKLTVDEEASVVLLQHVILASHGQREFGSPVEPNLMEAIIVSSLDALDARIYRVNDELEKVTAETGWTPRVLTENGRQFLKHFKKEK
ncbi:3'-5' exoribonuclease YhaM [Spiroplasma clarkii]|uniref:3'-5' exoribonuclease n=1 Tax=Spiroplasma clarkii TaxID=2139 RepID=A0A1Y0KZU5_9MOLU|nr:HD domain-containing protein [Spiroplasma clarkii]ARU91267.1 3'-5' exoribonuclease YhaM [Spiroplasma clarkii]ATX70704.1 3'-5' exoribonuclease [Spiroplasma clarkii]